ncbi:MAG: SCO family protein [Candidatus Eremiobacteraeota bacterium]|nr:SCO family protein [Candidatus Eremiobacteraeota bacterium]
MLATVIALALATLFPLHGTVLGSGLHGTVVVRNDVVTGMLAAQTREYRVIPQRHYDVGEGIDAFVNSRDPHTLLDASPAGRFAPGVPDRGKVEPIDFGSRLPTTRLIDQAGSLVDLAAFHNKVVLLSFVFTRCPDKDECPAISGKFASLQRHLNHSRFHLVEMTLDPVYDSPKVLATYAKTFGADPRAWSIVTGQPQEVQHLLNRFGISSLRVSEANFIHNDKVFVADGSGKVADVVLTAGFSSDALTAQAQHIAGMRSSAWGRLQLALVAGAVALCGGSQFAGIVLLETLLFLAIAGSSFVALSFLARHLVRNP